ncbi:MAG: hypothetical protein ND807_04375 [Vicinamibacterales bacterium]|nr:hypothetical protein [Vicinamibacterales bacterium]
MRIGDVRLLTLVVALACSTIATAANAQARTDRFGDGPLRTLRPGSFVVQKQTVPVDLVFIGYDSRQIDERALLASLPATYSPIVRYPQFYGLNGRDMGLEFQFKYRAVHETRAFTDQFFSFLARTGTDGPLTAFQDQYNQQQKNVLDVAGPVLYIDAPTVERYLATHGFGDQRGYTIYFINWYGRRDFRFHVYTKTDEVDPDTGYNFGSLRGSRKMIAWGGSVSRTWFYDLSAGPESWTNNWSVDDDQTEYHMPPIWEYRTGGYRPAARLTRDLGLVTRYVGIDLLFTTSPLYDPLVTAPDVGGSKVVHVGMLEDDPASNGRTFIDTEFTKRELRRFEPYYSWKVGLSDTKPVDAGAKRTLDIFSGNLLADDCWNAFGTPFAQMFCYFSANLAKYIPEYRPRDYVGEIFAYNTTAANLGDQFGLLGFADDNWVDGTQTHVFMFDSNEYRALGYGFTTTGIHEFGHHIGMSHPHDGYDSENDLEFDASGPFEFAWSGDESHTVMHYIALANGFGVFDRDNQYRWETAGYLNWSNAVLGDIVTHPKARQVWPLIRQADDAAADAVEAFRRWDYLEGVAKARLAYSEVALAAQLIGASTPTLDAARRALPGTAVRRIVCTIRNPYD